jgi:hypothetical protein
MSIIKGLSTYSSQETQNLKNIGISSPKTIISPDLLHQLAHNFLNGRAFLSIVANIGDFDIL